jgi:cytochrome c oxidase subunit 3
LSANYITLFPVSVGPGGPEAIAVVDAGGHGHGHGHGHSHVAHQFDDLAQQKEASTLGMWAFLGTEIMFFGGAFLLYSIYRHAYPEAFAKASEHEKVFVGALNTAILLCSSFTVVLAVHAAHHANRKGIMLWFAVTVAFGLAFIGIKGYEYYSLYQERLVPGAHFDEHREMFPPKDNTPQAANEADFVRRGAQIFFSFYFLATGLHALHMLIGVGVVSYVIWMAHKGKFTREYYNPVEITGLYWHFVDIVWIFLYPLLYLVDRSSHGM